MSSSSNDRKTSVYISDALRRYIDHQQFSGLGPTASVSRLASRFEMILSFIHSDFSASEIDDLRQALKPFLSKYSPDAAFIKLLSPASFLPPGPLLSKLAALSDLERVSLAHSIGV